MKRWGVLVVVVALCTPAYGHESQGWFWTAEQAATMFRQHFPVASVHCEGIGHGPAKATFRHFDCAVDSERGTMVVALHVLGHRAFKAVLIARPVRVVEVARAVPLLAHPSRPPPRPT